MSEAEAWMSEQELYMMGDDRGKDEPSAGQLIKKHDTIEAAIADYAETVNELGERARGLTDSGHPERYPFSTCVIPYSRRRWYVLDL